MQSKYRYFNILVQFINVKYSALVDVLPKRTWEQRKLGDYLLVSTEKNSSDRYGRADVLSVSGDFGIVNQIEFQGRSFAGASVSNYGVVQTGDVVYTTSPLNSNP